MTLIEEMRNKFLIVWKSTISENILKVWHWETENLGDIEKRLKLFFEAGVTPEFAENPKDADIIKSMFELI